MWIDNLRANLKFSCVKGLLAVALLVASLLQPSISGAVNVTMRACCCEYAATLPSCCDHDAAPATSKTSTETPAGTSCEEEGQCQQCQCSSRTFAFNDGSPLLQEPAMLQCAWVGRNAILISHSENPQSPPPKLS